MWRSMCDFGEEWKGVVMTLYVVGTRKSERAVVGTSMRGNSCAMLILATWHFTPDYMESSDPVSCGF